MAYLQLRGIEKSFGEARVIKGVNDGSPPTLRTRTAGGGQ